MKKIFLFVSPFIFLMACSSSDDNSSPTPQNSITGVWEVTELELDGIDLMPAYSENLSYYHPDGTYELKAYLATDGSYVNAIGEYSISDDISYSKSTILTGANEGFYSTGSSSLSWVNNNEVTSSTLSNPCISAEGFSRSVKTTNSLGNAPANSLVGIWSTNSAILGGQDIFSSNYSQVLDYFWADGTVGTDLYHLDGGFDWAIGTYSIYNNVVTISQTLNSTGETITQSMNITKLEIDEVELYSSDFLGTGQTYNRNASKVECTPLSDFWKKKK